MVQLLVLVLTVIKVRFLQYQEQVIQQFHLLEVVTEQEIQKLPVMVDLVVEVEVEILVVLKVLVILQVHLLHKVLMVDQEQV